MPDLLLYMSYGRDCYHEETMYSLLSARRFAAWDNRGGDSGAAGWRPLVYTDRPADYEWLGIEVRELTPALIADWVGMGYPFRRKIACVVDALERTTGKLAFLDGDTWFRRDPRLLFDRIAPGRTCLHLRELRLTRRPGTAGAALGPLFDRGIVRDPAGGPVRLRRGEAMWNSGVIGVDAEDTGKVRDALALIDAVWAHIQSVHTLEQFALGHIFADGTLQETDDLVFHYWHARHRAPFLARLSNIIARARQMPLAEAAEWSWRQRPTERAMRRVAGVVRDAAHRAGIDRRWTRTSF